MRNCFVESGTAAEMPDESSIEVKWLFCLLWLGRGERI